MSGISAEASPIECANCFEEFSWEPAYSNGEAYCCDGCVMGGPCICSYSGPAPRLNAEGVLAILGDGTGTGPVEAAAVATECANCFERMRRPPVYHEGRPYCCHGCASGGPCVCTYVDGAIERSKKASRAVPVEPSPRKTNRFWGAEAVDIVPHPPLLREARGYFRANVNSLWRKDETQKPSAKHNRLWDATDKLSVATVALRTDAPPISVQRAKIADTLRTASQSSPATLKFKLSASPLIELIDVKMFATQLENIPSVEKVQLVRYEGDRATFEVEASSINEVTREILDMSYFRVRSLRTTSEGVELVLAPKGMDLSGRQPSVQRDERLSPRQTPPPQDGGASRYEMGVDVFFNGRHQVEVGGVKGPVHMHSWRVQAVLEGSAESAIGASEVRQIISSFVMPFNEKLLNKTPPFNHIMPTDHNIARVIYGHVKGELEGKGVRLKSIRLWESPTSYVEYSGEGFQFL